jgi:hypothetical protein
VFSSASVSSRGMPPIVRLFLLARPCSTGWLVDLYKISPQDPPIAEQYFDFLASDTARADL